MGLAPSFPFLPLTSVEILRAGLFLMRTRTGDCTSSDDVPDA